MVDRQQNLERQLAAASAGAPHGLTELWAVIIGRSELVMRQLGHDHPSSGDDAPVSRAAKGAPV
jgi:hypothetical protein